MLFLFKHFFHNMNKGGLLARSKTNSIKYLTMGIPSARTGNTKGTNSKKSNICIINTVFKFVVYHRYWIAAQSFKNVNTYLYAASFLYHKHINQIIYSEKFYVKLGLPYAKCSLCHILLKMRRIKIYKKSMFYKIDVYLNILLMFKSRWHWNKNTFK
jgi:hypothetical protein